MENSKCLEEIFKLLEVATSVPSNSERKFKNTEGPVDYLVEELEKSIAKTFLHSRFDEISEIGNVASTSKTTDGAAVLVKGDSRVQYSKLMTIIFSELSELIKGSASESNDESSIISMQQTLLLTKSLEFFIIMCLLPALDPDVGIPVEKRSSFIKYWKPFECELLRKSQLECTIQIFQSLSNANPTIRTHIIGRFLSDFIAANEQLLFIGCADHHQSYEQFLSNVPKALLFKELLSLLGMFTVRAQPKQAPAWFQKAISIRLSRLLLSEDSLSCLFVAFDDLGGASFWENSAALHNVAVLLSKKPSVSKAPAYYRQLLKQFLALLKVIGTIQQLGPHLMIPTWSEKISKLFASVVELISKKASNDLHFQVIDKLASPWDICLERGKLNPFSIGYGFWNSYMDDSLWILKTWFKGLYRQSEIPCIERFEKFCPFLMHLCGQSSNVKDLEAFANDSALVIGTIVRGINSDRMGNTLLKMILTPETGNRLYSFFKVDVYKKPLIQEISKEENSRKYNLHLEIVNEPFSEIEMLDYKVYAVDLILKQFDREESSALLVDLLSACVYEWRSIESEQLQSVVDNEYQPFIVELGKERIDRERNHLSVQYVLSALTEQLIDLKMEFSNVSLLKLLEVAELMFSSMLRKLNHVLSMDLSIEADLEVDAKSSELALGIVSGVLLMAKDSTEIMDRLKLVSFRLQEFCRLMEKAAEKLPSAFRTTLENCQQLLALFSDLSLSAEDSKPILHPFEIPSPINKFDRKSLSNLSDLLKELESPDEPIRGHVLIEIGKELRKRNSKFFKSSVDFDLVYERILAQVQDPDTYVFLAAINALAELAYWKTDPFLEKMLDYFVKWHSSEEPQSLMVRTKIGEAVAKVCNRLGDFSPLYFDRLAPTFLLLVKESDEMIRASALSSLSDLILACRGRRYDRIVNELLLCISQVITTDKSPLVRRAAVHFLRCMLSSAHDVLFEVFMDSLRDINRQLRRLWEYDQDDVVRLQAELALIEIKEAIKTSLDKI